MNKTLYLIIAFLFLSLTAYPQGNNAVSITIIGSGSYSSKLADFYSISNEGMLTVMLRNQDFKEAVIPVQLYMSVTNLGDTYILTKSPNPTQPINLNSGETVALTGTDLSRLFNTAYLTYKGTNLRDGTNVLKIYARDTRTGKVVSNTASITLKSVVIGAPKLLAPDNGIVIETDNPFHLFRWQGDNGGSHKASAYNYFYTLEIWRQNNNDPNVEVQRNPDFFADYLKAEQYQMLFSSYPFEIGQKYCWRVRAYDPTERTTFINEGKSEVRSFTYKHLPVPVTGLTHKIKETTRVATATWNAAEGHTKYYIEYYNPQTKKTISNTTNEPKYTLSAAPEGDYKILFRVKAQCWNDDNRQSSWTPWDTIHYTPRPHVESEYECGHKFPKVEITNYSLKTDFEEGDIVSEANGSSNYEIINYAVDADSTLRGQFYLVMNAWGGTKIACDFWDTKINTDNVIITTRYRSLDLPGYVADPDEIQRYVKSLWLDANSVATSSKIRDTIVIKEKFDYLYAADDGTLYAVVVNPNGTVTETKVSTNKSTSQCLVTDGKGDSLVISKNGQPMGIQEYRATGGNKALLKEYHRKSDSLAQWQINFSKYDAQTYAFDRIASGDHGIFATDEYYPKSGNYDFRYKSVECGKTDRIVVDFGSYSEKDSVIFKDKYGVTLKVVDNNILTFTGVSNADTNFIYAYRGDKKIGKLFLNTYQRKTYKVVLVSVNDATLPNTSTLADYLNKVYRQCVDSFEITTDKIKIDDLKTFSHGGSGILTVYNDDQKKVLKAYDSKMQDNTYYLFFVDGVTDKKDGSGTLVSGYMPRGYNCGFIYDGGSEHTIAHELGHGIAGLEHVFENSNNSGKTANLMDYANGEELWHFQWDQIQDPSRVWMKWNKAESEGEKQIGDDYVCTMKFINAFCYAFHNHTRLTYPADGPPYFGHSTNHSMLSRSKIVHFNVKVKKDINQTPKSNKLSDYSDYFTITCDDNSVTPQELFDYFIETYNNRRHTLELNIFDKNASQPNRLIENLSIYPEKIDYGSIDINSRNAMLLRLSHAESLTEGSFASCNINSEQLVIDLIKSTPDKDIDKMLTFVLNSDIFTELSYHIDGDNYMKFLAELTQKWVTLNKERVLSAQNDISKADRYFYWDRSNDNRKYYTYKGEYDKGKISLKYWAGDRYDVLMYEHLGWGSYKKYHYETIDAQDVVLLHCNTTPEVFFSYAKKNQILIIPGFLFYAMNEKFLFDRNVDYFETGVTIASFALGVGEIAAAARGWKAASGFQKFWAIFNAVIGTADVVFSNSAVDRFIAEQFKAEDGKNYMYFAYKLLSKSLDLISIKDATMALEISNAFILFREGWAAFKIGHEIQNFTSEEQLIMKEIDDFIEQIENDENN